MYKHRVHDVAIRGNKIPTKTIFGGMKHTLHKLWTALLVVLAAHPLSTVATEAAVGIDDSRRNAITRAVEVCEPAIVGINVTETRRTFYRDPYWPPFFEQFLGGRGILEEYDVQGVGSGFLISDDGYILTNDHVAGTASKVIVTMTDGSKHDAEVIGTDPVTDVALLKIEGEDLPHLEFADSEDVIVGEWSIAFGNPFGLFDNNAKPTVTVGVVSNVGINFTQRDRRTDDRVYKGMIQTDAAISSGNSGGPLVNSEGEVIGINTVIYSTAQSRQGAGSIGIGFAIPISRASRIVERLKEDGSINRDFWTGMRLQALDEDIAGYYKLSRTEGILVTKTASNSPADKCGLEPGDVIIAIDDALVKRNEDVNIAVLDGEVGQTITLLVDRNGEELTKEMILEQRPNNRRRR